MVRINLVNPKYLSDQHLTAEHVEILMLVSTAHKFKPENVPYSYRLGKGHMNFFKDKLHYLAKRFFSIQREMRKRGMKPKAVFPVLDVNPFQFKDYTPGYDDLEIIKHRIKERLARKPEWYSYYGEKLNLKEWLILTEGATI